MLTFNFTPFPSLETERLFLRRMTVADANEIFILRTDKEITKYLDRGAPNSVEEIHDWIKLVDSEIDENRGISWGMYLKPDNQFIGSIGIWRTIPEHHRGEIGYSLLREYQRKGYTFEAMIAALKYGFHVMKLHGVDANIHPDNKASQGILEKVGFVKEAHFKENYYYNGYYTDSAIYCLLEKNFKYGS
jgi:[ribosomal protein S5]-alanine N-acetyltransferase